MSIPLIIVLPAYQARSTLAATLGELPPGLEATLLLVDDASTDGTADLARSLGLEVIVHPKNRGYGANQKTCYKAALARGAECIAMLHPDHQYDAKAIAPMSQAILRGQADLSLGSRFMGGALVPQGMPLWRALGNRGLTYIQNGLLGSHLSEFHTGLRAYSRALLLSLPFDSFSDGFLFDQELLASAIKGGARIAETAIETRYFKDASSIPFGESLRYGVQTLQATWRLSR